jgi:hypothetical protein
VAPFERVIFDCVVVELLEGPDTVLFDDMRELPRLLGEAT